MAGRIGRLNHGERFKVGREQRVEVFVHPGRVGKDRVSAAVGQLMSKQRGEGWRVWTETAIGMPDMIAQILVLHRIDHGRVGIFWRARRMRPRIMEELAEETGKRGEVFRRHCAGFEDRQAAIVENIAQGRTEFIGQRFAVEFEPRNDRAKRGLDLRDPHARRHCGFRNQSDC
jgi:hypothetical protein